MDFGTLILLAIVGAVVWVIVDSVFQSNRKKEMEEKLRKLPDFTSTQKVMGTDGRSGLAVDDHRKMVSLIKHEGGKVSTKRISYRDLLSSEIYVDGATVTKTARGSQIGGALIGGLALGGVGAIIGGLSGKTKSSEKVKRIDLRLTVNDRINPIHDVNFMDAEVKKDGTITKYAYKSAMDQARHWHGLIAVLIKEADSEDAAQKEATKASSTGSAERHSITDELIKLGELRDKGVLTEKEFNAQKKRLLS